MSGGGTIGEVPRQLNDVRPRHTLHAKERICIVATKPVLTVHLCCDNEAEKVRFAVSVLVPVEVAVFAVAVCALYVHSRGRDRLVFRRQVCDHSTFLAPYNCLVYLFSGVESTPILDVEDFPQLRPLRDHWRTIRDEAARTFAPLKATTTLASIRFSAGVGSASTSSGTATPYPPRKDSAHARSSS